jgi:alpha-beta hydrolase superfamily lysophospholipase
VVERFEVDIGADRLVGYWHWPEGRARKRRPAIVMGHGFGTEWTFGTSDTIRDFTEAGYAVVTFDYRHFGESGGRPRHLLLIHKQLEDWRSVLAYVRENDRIDPARLAVWGASLGGGHAMTMAAEKNGIAAAVLQAPHCSAFDAMSSYPTFNALVSAQHALLDLYIAPFGGVHKIPMINEPGRLGAVTFAGWAEEAKRFIPAGSDWQNEIPARSLLSLGRYSPGQHAPRIECPVCIHYGKRDFAVPPHSVERTARKIQDVEIHPYDGEHFDIYHGPLRAEITESQVEFLKRRL